MVQQNSPCLSGPLSGLESRAAHVRLSMVAYGPPSSSGAKSQGQFCVRKECAKRGCIAPAEEHFQPTFVVVLDLGRSENSANATGKRNQNSKETDGQQTTMVGALAGKPQESSSESTASCSRRLQVRSSYCRSDMNFSQMPFKDEIPPARRCRCLSELVWTSSRTPQE